MTTHDNGAYVKLAVLAVSAGAALTVRHFWPGRERARTKAIMWLAGDRPVMLNLKIQPQVVARGDGALIGHTTLDGTGSPLVSLTGIHAR